MSGVEIALPLEALSMWCAHFDRSDMHPARSLYREKLRSLGQSLRLVSSSA